MTSRRLVKVRSTFGVREHLAVAGAKVTLCGYELRPKTAAVTDDDGARAGTCASCRAKEETR